MVARRHRPQDRQVARTQAARSGVSFRLHPPSPEMPWRWGASAPPGGCWFRAEPGHCSQPGRLQADPVQFDVVSEGPIDPGAEPKEVEVSTYVAGDGEPIARALLMAKAIHQRGDDLSRTGSDLDAMIAIHHVHLAVEMALREVASRRRMPYQKRDPTFDDLLQFVEASLNDSGHITALPHLGELRTLNRHR